MKYIILILLLLSFNGFAIDIINSSLTFEMGIIPAGHLRMYDFTRRVYKELSFYGDFTFKVNMFNDHLYYGVGTKIYMWKIRESKTFKPDSVNFLFFAGFRFNENVEIGFRHYCDHPIKAWDNGSNTFLERWYEEIYIKLNFFIGNNK